MCTRPLARTCSPAAALRSPVRAPVSPVAAPRPTADGFACSARRDAYCAPTAAVRRGPCRDPPPGTRACASPSCAPAAAVAGRCRRAAPTRGPPVASRCRCNPASCLRALCLGSAIRPGDGHHPTASVPGSAVACCASRCSTAHPGAECDLAPAARCPAHPGGAGALPGPASAHPRPQPSGGPGGRSPRDTAVPPRDRSPRRPTTSARCRSSLPCPSIREAS